MSASIAIANLWNEVLGKGAFEVVLRRQAPLFASSLVVNVFWPAVDDSLPRQIGREGEPQDRVLDRDRSRRLGQEPEEEAEQELLQRFGSLEAIRGATLDELAATPGVGPGTAERILAALAEGAEA